MNQPGPYSYSIPGTRYGLDSLLIPRTIVLLDGMDHEGSTATAVWKNLTSTFVHGKIRRIRVAVDCRFTDTLPANLDLAVIIVPREKQVSVLLECDAQQVRFALLISPDHREPGHQTLSSEMLHIRNLCKNGLRILGPQSYGIINPYYDLNLTPQLPTPRCGNIALLSQSGTLCTAILDWSFRTGVGFSAVVSCGQMIDVNWHDLITHFGDDPYTKSIVIYIETIGDARSFLSAAREVALSKPIIVLKAGRTSTAAAVAVSHSHGDGQSDALLDAALQRVGVLRVRTIAELFYMASILATQPLPKGPRLAIITNAIGPAIMATDTLLFSGGELAKISPGGAEKLKSKIPHASPCDNPVDIMGDAGPEQFGQALGIISREKDTDGILVILTPQFPTQPTAAARRVAEITGRINKPVLASWMGGDRVAEGQNVLYDAGIPAFPYPDTPARLFALMWQQAQNLKSIYETPSIVLDEDKTPNDPASVNIVLEGIRNEGRTELTEWEAKAILRAYGLPVIETLPATSEDQAITIANLFGFPVLLKVLSTSPSLKKDIHGVRMVLRTEQDVQDAFRSIKNDAERFGREQEFLGVTVQRMVSTRGIELIAGSRIDQRFGPYLYFGMGGQMTEIINDRVLGLPPLTTALAQRLIEQTKIWNTLKSNTIDHRIKELQSCLVRLSQLVTQHPLISEIEINPIVVTEGLIIALDARISIHPQDINMNDLPRTAIRPYPDQYIWTVNLRRVPPVLIRPVRPEDEPLIVEFHKILSEETIYRRYFFQHKLTRRTSHERLRRTCFLDFDREIALAAVIHNSDGIPVITAVGRLSRNRDHNTAEIALVVADPYQGKGVGTVILSKLVEIARLEKIRRVEGTMLPGNIHMQHLFGKLGFEIHPGSDDTVVAYQNLDPLV